MLQWLSADVAGRNALAMPDSAVLQVLVIVYFGSDTTPSGFFPSGVSGLTGSLECWHQSMPVAHAECLLLH